MKLYAPDAKEPETSVPARDESSSRNYRGVRDEILEQQRKTKDMPVKERLSYFWEYYKIHLLVVILVIVFGISLIHNFVTAKDAAFTAIMLNSAPLEQDILSASFAEYAGIDTETYDCVLDTLSTLSYRTMTEADIATTQKLTAQVQTKELDAAVFDSLPFNIFANNGIFADLRTLYSAEELEKYDLYYIDYAELRRSEDDPNYRNKNLIDFESPDVFSADALETEAETHRHPETMEEPVPVGIFMVQSPLVLKTYAYAQTIPVFGIIVNSEHTDLARQYLDFLWDENISFEQMQRNY